MTEKAIIADAANAAICATRAAARRPRALPNMRKSQPRGPAHAVAAPPNRSLPANVYHNGAGSTPGPSRKCHFSRKLGPWCFRATLRQWKGWWNDPSRTRKLAAPQSPAAAGRRHRRSAGRSIIPDGAIECGPAYGGARPTTATSRPRP
jgi:hypothetical protein